MSLTSSAISHQIRVREDILGCSLFRRRPRPLALTEAGATFFPVIRDGLDAFAAATAQVRDGIAQQKLRVTTTNAFAGRAGWYRAYRFGAKPIPRLRSR